MQVVVPEYLCAYTTDLDIRHIGMWFHIGFGVIET